MLESGSIRWSVPASILLATDLGDIDRLFPLALRQAQHSGARILLLHVLTATNSITVDPGGLPYYRPTEAVSYAEEFLAPYRADAQRLNIACEVLVREGGAAQQILTTVRQMHADRVLLGTRSHGKWGKLLLGSVAEEVLRSAMVPVMTVGPEVVEREADGDQAILHGTSLSRASRASAALACEVARTTQARLVMMHVLTPSKAGGSQAAAAVERARLALSALIPDDLACKCACTPRVAVGNIAIELLAEAAAVNASLIVLGAARSSPIGALAREGTVYRVLAHARCPVLTLREMYAATETEPHLQGLALHE